MAWANANWRPKNCRSELAREKPEGAAFNLAARVIVDVFREQARSYRGLGDDLTEE
jgi:hypothetical protein